MAELLIIVGVSALIITTLGLMHEAGSRGHSSLFFLVPLVSLGQVQSHWEYYRWWALGRVAAVLTTAVGIGLFVVTGGSLAGDASLKPVSSQSGQVLRGEKKASSTAFVSSEESALLVVARQGKRLTGRLHGETFRYDRVALIDGVMTLSQGEGFLADLEVRILLGWNPEDITERRTLIVGPSDEDGPVVHLSWKPENQDYPETRIFDGGYRMELALAPLDTGQLSGSLVLVMPDSFKSYLAGDFTAHTNHLRYRNGQVDLYFDHEDTLAHVAEEFLRTQFPEGAVSTIEARHVTLRRTENSGQVMAVVELSNGAVQERTVRLEKSDVGWAVVAGSMETRVTTAAKEGGLELVAPSAEKPAEPERAAPEPIMQTFPELVAYENQSVVLETTGGRTLEGVLRKVDGDRLWLVMNVGSGNVERSVGADELQSLTLSSGQRVMLTVPGGDQSAADEPVDSPSTPSHVESAPAEPTEQAPVANSELKALLGKNVTIEANEGPSRTGILQAVADDHLTLSVPLGAGNMEYFYDIDSIRHIEAAR
jgi:small nuclear ribonucleoprotein (snRNP)-like protein